MHGLLVYWERTYNDCAGSHEWTFRSLPLVMPMAKWSYGMPNHSCTMQHSVSIRRKLLLWSSQPKLRWRLSVLRSTEHVARMTLFAIGTSESWSQMCQCNLLAWQSIQAVNSSALAALIHITFTSGISKLVT
jgi:hypothetical protein